MVKSMTGYGHFEEVTKEYKITVEMKSVNHRYCDISIKLPRKFNALEGKLRRMMKQYAGRGKIDIYINFADYTDGDVKVQYHERIAQDYVRAIQQAKENFSLDEGLTAASLVRYPEVISLEEESHGVEDFFPVVEKALNGAGEAFLHTKELEGANLQKDILGKLSYIETLLAFVEERSPELLDEYRNKIQNKVRELLGENQMDEKTLATELIIYADKVCVDEETVRLRSHISHMRETFLEEKPVGRKLDFISQEMNREANTILSKVNDKELSQKAIDLKTEIEKIREQIQNIE